MLKHGRFDFDRRPVTEPEARPYHAEYILPNQTSVHNRTADALWIRVDGNRQNAIAPQGVNETGYTLYELNPDTYQIRRALEYGRANDTVQAVHEFDSYGETDVSRPKATRNLAVNLLSDLVR